MKVRLCCPGEEIIEIKDNDIDSVLAEACRRTNYKYFYAIIDGGYAHTKCDCVKCLDKCEEIEDEGKRRECWWRCRCGPCSNPFTGGC